MVSGGIFYLFTSFEHLRDSIYNGIHLYVFILSGFLFYFLLFKSKLVPHFISVWGIIAILMLLVRTALNILGIVSPIVDSFLILIIANEIFLAIWLMIKGFNFTPLNSQDNKN
jgi:hypothetical protein